MEISILEVILGIIKKVVNGFITIEMEK